MFGVIDVSDDIDPVDNNTVPKIKNKLNPINMPKQVLIECIEDNYDTLRDDAREVCRLFDSSYKQWPLEFSNDMVRNVLDYINGKLKSHYGVKILSNSKKGNIYKLDDSIDKHFKFNESGKLIPKI
jgi:hypothetical protein